MVSATSASREIDEGLESPAGELFYFFCSALGYPEESIWAWLCSTKTKHDVLGALGRLPGSDELITVVRPLMDELAGLGQDLSFEMIEAAYIAMFACGYPRVLCPPYGSLYTAPDEDKRLEEMIAVKTFYEACGVVITDNFRDLPDHVCVEFEFLQYMAYEIARTQASGDSGPERIVARHTLDFLDQYLVGLLDGMSKEAAGIATRNIYCPLIEVAASVTKHYRDSLIVLVNDLADSAEGGEA